MKLLIIILVFFNVNLLASSDKFLKQRNVLYTQNLISLEEKIAFAYEKYLLTHFKIPKINDLTTNKFLGTNFSDTNIMGDNINFQDAENLKLKFAISKHSEDYMIEIYKRDLYRDRTSVYMERQNKKVDLTKSFVEIILKSDESKTIHKLLKAGETIKETCSIENKKNIYCNYNKSSLRWYFNDSSWIEYDKKLLNSGNVTIKNVAETNSKLYEQDIGTYIFIENGSKYIRLINNQVMKVE